MSYWLTDPELFLYAKGTGFDDVHLWRCKKLTSSSSLVVPMKPDDFDYVSDVKNHQELIEDLFDWDELDFKRLVEYIYENRLLVNSQGFVIAELLHKANKDGNKTIDAANEEDVRVIYIRSLDVLSLKPYIPNLRERPIPLRTVKYLGDVNGKAAMMEEDSNITKLTTRVENLEAENTRLESQVTKLMARVENLEAMYSKEVWMNDLTNSEWVGIEGISRNKEIFDNLIIVGPLGTYIADDNSTNVRATYWNSINPFAGTSVYKAISIDDLPNKEKARFSDNFWCSFKSKGKTYVYRA